MLLRTVTFMSALALALALAACSGPSLDETPAETSATVSQGGASGCEAQASSRWTTGPETNLTLEARSLGESCAEALATLIIRGSDGALLWASAYPTADVMTLRDASDATGMEAALTRWIEAGDRTTADLPEWPTGKDAPNAGDFPFYPEEGWDAASFSELRQAAAPMFCHVQGIESLRCLSAKDGAVSTIGVQTFPG